MKKLLLLLFLFVYEINAQSLGFNIVQDLKTKMAKEDGQTEDSLRQILDTYFNDGCKIKINDEELILKRDNFSKYAKIGAIFCSKISKGIQPKDLKQEFSKTDSKSLFKEEILKTSVKISEKKQIFVDFLFRNCKLSGVICEDIPLNFRQTLTLRGIFNLLR